jgi:type III pantothenate kinase
MLEAVTPSLLRFTHHVSRFTSLSLVTCHYFFPTFAPIMNLVIDAGNTLIKSVVYDQAHFVSAETYPEWAPEAFENTLNRSPGIESCLVCSTREVPGWVAEWMKSRNVRFHELTHLTPLPIGICYETPETLGKDRIAAAAGAAGLFPGRNIAAIDAGTALTIDLITDKGFFAGGNISPGLRMRFAALHQQTYSLPQIEP